MGGGGGGHALDYYSFVKKKSSACCLCLLKRLFRLALVLLLAKRRRAHRVSLLEHISVWLSLSVQLFESVHGTVLHDEFHRVSIDAGGKKKREREEENIVSVMVCVLTCRWTC